MGLKLPELILILVVLLVLCSPVLALAGFGVWYLRRPKCPFCMGRIRTGSTVCHHCQRALPASGDMNPGGT